MIECRGKQINPPEPSRSENALMAEFRRLLNGAASVKVEDFNFTDPSTSKHETLEIKAGGKLSYSLKYRFIESDEVGVIPMIRSMGELNCELKNGRSISCLPRGTVRYSLLGPSLPASEKALTEFLEKFRRDTGGCVLPALPSQIDPLVAKELQAISRIHDSLSDPSSTEAYSIRSKLRNRIAAIAQVYQQYGSAAVPIDENSFQQNLNVISNVNAKYQPDIMKLLIANLQDLTKEFGGKK